MNYAFKFQPSTCIISNQVSPTKSFNSGDIVRAHCFRKYLNSRNNGKNFSAHSAALKLLLKKKVNTNENARKKLINYKYEKEKNFTELIKLIESKSREVKMKIHQIKSSGVTEYAEKPEMIFETTYCNVKYICNCTRSFDPNLLILNEDAQKWYKEESSAVDLDIQNDKQTYNFDILESFPLESGKILSLPKDKVESKSNLDFIKLKEDYFSNNNNNQITNLKLLQDQDKYLVKDFNKNDLKYNVNEFFKEINYKGLTDEKKFIHITQSFIDVAVNSENLKEALNMLSQIRNRSIWKSNYVKKNASEFCGTLMNAYALMGDWKTLSTIRNWMRTDKIDFNYQCYAALLDCLGKTKKNVHSKHSWHEDIKEVLEDVQKMNLSINGLFTETTLNTDQRQNILNTIRKIYPHFVITPKKMNLNSQCDLTVGLYLNKSNLKSQIDDCCFDNTLKDLVNIQAQVENNFSIKIKPVPTKKTVFNKIHLEEIAHLKNLKKEWRKELMNGFLQNLKLSKYSFLQIYLNCLPPNLFVDLMIEEIDNLSNFSDFYTQSMILCYKNLGEKVERRFENRKKVQQKACENTIKLFHKYCDWYACPSGPAKNSRQQWQMILQENVSYHPPDVIHFKWPSKITINLGKFLYDIILKKVKYNSGTSSNPSWTPVFYRIIRFNSVSEEQIKIHPDMSKIFKNVGFYSLTFEALQCPMLCPPKPWISVNEGGYLTHSSAFYRKHSEQVFKTVDLQKVPSHELYAAFDSLNAIQNTPWKINGPVLDVILEVFKNGGCDKLDVAKFPKKNVERCENLKFPDSLKARNESKKLVQEQKDQYALWCEALYRLSLANHFRDKIFWLPYNFDFRGRLYPIPPLINHLGSDTYRALLLFGKGKPLGPKGLDWIKIHTISLTGTHKNQSLEERLKYANSILPAIIDSAKNPLNGDGWWKKSDEPWQTLAACMEIKKALDCSCLESYITYLPIHQDGSCNGLQHYAALGKDKEGGISVNLTPCSEPQDVYNSFVSVIEKQRKLDAENGVFIAKILEGYVRRKVLKQTVMTTVYGVTMYGAKLQIAKQLEDIDSFPKQYVWQAATYLANQVFECLKQMFRSAREIQTWLAECANVISKKNHVHWVSPIGLPIVQPYSSSSKIRTVENGLKTSSWQPNKRKQRSAFPPNFIHSLDSSHLMLTALFCEQAGITFASIHDCYWTHPITVDAMNKICREQFLSLHSQPILQRLSESFVQYFGKDEKKKIPDEKSVEIFRKLPKPGELDLTKVLESVYFFS